MVTFDEFKKLELKVGEIKEVSDCPNADRLYIIKIDVGGEIKQSVAGIKKFYAPEQILGKKVVVLNNLQPTVIRGVESQVMILAASDEAGLSVLVPDKKEVKTGSKIS
ncbi:MAG: hypothetical protein HY350_05235 [Candidatus Omnitrophica bacterium]|nr:hypothetical protein [Candidatus Omnitrophota bacterium]